MTLLAVEGLCSGYGQGDILHDIDLSVDDGETVVVLGANGAGKTTTMRALSGLLRRRGSIDFAGESIDQASPEQIVALGIALVPQGRGTFTQLSVEDNLSIGAYRRPRRSVADDIERWYSTFPILAERRHQSAGTLSGGEQQMLAIARAMMSHPRLLLLDEPSLGLAPLIVSALFAQIEELSRSENMAVLLVEQNVNLAMGMAQRVYLLEAGAIVSSGTAAEISADDSIRKAFLGY